MIKNTLTQPYRGIGNTNSVFNKTDYCYLNFAIIIALFLIMVYPIIVMTLHINLKTCTEIGCPSCGVTRDFYSILTFKFLSGTSLINKHSIYIFTLLLFMMIFRIPLLLSQKNPFAKFNRILQLDLSVSVCSLLILYILFNA
jgi:hypothetical protein